MKRLFYTMLAVCLLVLLALPAGAAERDTAFSDQAEIRNGYAVQMLVELELIGGYKDGSFQPGAPITRAETAKLIAFFLHGYARACLVGLPLRIRTTAGRRIILPIAPARASSAAPADCSVRRTM